MSCRFNSITLSEARTAGNNDGQNDREHATNVSTFAQLAIFLSLSLSLLQSRYASVAAIVVAL